MSRFEMFFPKGGEAGPQAARLVAEVIGTTAPKCTRMYTKGIPQGRQVNKEYSILHSECELVMPYSVLERVLNTLIIREVLNL